jgi:transposase
MFRPLVIARVVRPTSKLGTVDYLRREFKHTRAISGGRIGAVFYDVITLNFEAERRDDFRIPGFSKDRKTKRPQIILGLLVGAQGTPLAYEIFKGNAFEGRTMIPVLEAFAKRFRLAIPIVVADAGLMSKSNIMELERLGYQYILGARIKNMDAPTATLALGLRRIDGKSEEFNLTDRKRLIVHYSAKRAKTDNHYRERGLMKLEEDEASGRLTKEDLTHRGYKYFLSLKGETKVKVDRSKIQEAQRWDGLKGYVTNTSLSKDEVLAGYRALWQIERSFRVAKSNLAARPIYHRLEHRIRTHICLCFAALKVHKKLERMLQENGCPWLVHESNEIARTIKTLHGIIPETLKTIEYMMIKTEEQAELASKMKFEVKNSLRNY